MSTPAPDDQQAALAARIERNIQGMAIMSVLVGFGLGGIGGTLWGGILSGCALSVFCAALAYPIFMAIVWMRPTLVVPRSVKAKP